MNDEAESPQTYYQATAVARPTRPKLTQDVDTTVCIIGGGFAGLWTARALAQRGYDVVVLEGGMVAGEASGRGGGVAAAGFSQDIRTIVARVGIDDARSLYALSRDGLETVRTKLADGLPGVDPVPGQLLVQRHDNEDEVRREADYMGENFSHEMLVWPTERVRAELKSEKYFQALHDADAFSIHPLNLATALAKEIEDLGGRIFEHSAATSADLDGVRKSVRTETGRVRAQHVVFCGSAFIGDGFPALERTLLPLATYGCVTAPIADTLAETVRYPGAVSDTRRYFDYYRTIGDRLFWGGYITTDTRAPRRIDRLLGRKMARTYPALKDVAIEYAWCGIMGFAVHGMPQIGQLRPGVWINTGFGGQGLNTTAMGAELVASALAEHDDRWRLFIPFGLVWNGGAWGRRLMQVRFWQFRVADKFDEIGSRFAQWRKRRREASRARAAARAERREVKRVARDAARKEREAARAARAEERAERARKAEEMAARLRTKAEEAERAAEARAAEMLSAARAAEASSPETRATEAAEEMVSAARAADAAAGESVAAREEKAPEPESERAPAAKAVKPTPEPDPVESPEPPATERDAESPHSPEEAPAEIADDAAAATADVESANVTAKAASKAAKKRKRKKKGKPEGT